MCGTDAAPGKNAEQGAPRCAAAAFEQALTARAALLLPRCASEVIRAHASKH